MTELERHLGEHSRVLIVDDVPAMRRIIARCLNDLNWYNISESSNGADALERLKGGEFTLVICDLNMPKMNGIELLRTVRSDEKLRNLPFIMITAEGAKDQVMEAVDAGVSGYIVKPFSADLLERKLGEVFLGEGSAGGPSGVTV